jgi:uncharacterized protein YifE (UPF0438 family)
VLGASDNPETQLEYVVFYVEWQVRGALPKPLPKKLGERLIFVVDYIFAPEDEIDPRVGRAALKHWRKLKEPGEREAFARGGWVRILNWFRDERPKFDSNQWRAGWNVIDRRYRKWRQTRPGSGCWSSMLDEFEHDGYLIRPLTSAHELAEEGFRMKHCVATYTNKCQSNNYRLFSISHIASEKPIATVGIKNNGSFWDVDQVKGKLNRIPPPEVCRIGRVIESAYQSEEHRAARKRALARMKQIQEIRDEHKVYLERRGQVSESVRHQFSADEIELLEEYLPVVEALMAGDIQPINVRQVHFIAVAMGLGRPKTDLERLWLRYRRGLNAAGVIF